MAQIAARCAAISSIGLPPSDQSEWVWQSPLRSGADGGARGRRRDPASVFLEAGEIGRALAGEGFDDDALGLLADALERAEAAGGGEVAEFGVGEGADGFGGVAEGFDAVVGLAGAFEDVGDAIEGGYGVDGVGHFDSQRNAFSIRESFGTRPPDVAPVATGIRRG